MRREKNKPMLVITLLFVLLITLACYLEGTKNPKSTDENGEFRFILSGSVTDTWSWGPDSYTCDTRDEMKLTISYDDKAVLTLRGACFYSPVAQETCTVLESSLPCGLVVYGTYHNDPMRVTFTACNDPQANNGSGEIYIDKGPDIETFILRGQASCSFSNSDEQHTINFASP